MGPSHTQNCVPQVFSLITCQILNLFPSKFLIVMCSALLKLPDDCLQNGVLQFLDFKSLFKLKRCSKAAETRLQELSLLPYEFKFSGGSWLEDDLRFAHLNKK